MVADGEAGSRRLNKQRRVAVKVAFMSLGLLAATAFVRADDVSIKLEDVPKPVLSAVKTKFPEGKVTKALKEEEDGKTTYELVVEVEGKTLDVAVSDKGKLLEIEEPVDAAKLPEAVGAAIKAKYPESKIKKAEQVTKFEGDGDGQEGEKVFEILLTTEGKKNIEVKVSPKGKILEDEEDDDDKPAKKKDDGDKPGKKTDD